MKLKLWAVAAIVVPFFAAPAAAEAVRFMTGPQGGVWVPLGGALKAIWEKNVKDMSVQVLPGAGISNVRAVHQSKAEIGFGNSITSVDALAGREPFTEPHKNVCNLATLYPQYFQVVVLANSGIGSIKDMKGKSLTTQVKGNTGELITKQILEAAGLSYKDLKVSFGSYNDSVGQMQDGHAQIFTLGAAAPVSAVIDLATSRDVKLLDLRDMLEPMKKLNPGYTLSTVKAGTYPKQEKDVQVISYWTHIVVACKLPDEQVFAMTKSVAENVRDMAAINKTIEGLTPAQMAQDIGVPMHPGARKFYEGAGALKPGNRSQ